MDPSACHTLKYSTGVSGWLRRPDGGAGEPATPSSTRLVCPVLARRKDGRGTVTCHTLKYSTGVSGVGAVRQCPGTLFPTSGERLEEASYPHPSRPFLCSRK